MDRVRLITPTTDVIVETVIALYNTNGGMIHTANNGETEAQLASSLAACRPALTDVSLQLADDDLWITVPRGHQLAALPDGRVLGRFNDHNRQLDRVEIKQLAQARSVGTFDAQTAPDGSNIATLLCTDSAPHRWLSSAYVVVTNEHGTHTITGNLTTQLADTLDALDTMRNAQVQCIPRAACRELILNALVHRNYQQRHPIRVVVDNEAITVYSPGGPAGFASLTTLAQQHFHRNPALVAHCVQAGLMPGKGSGLQTLLTAIDHHLQALTVQDKHLVVSIAPIDETTASLLNWRQQRVLKHIAQHGNLSEHLLEQLFERTNLATVQQDLLELVESGRLVQVNSTRGRLYLMAP